MSQIRLAISYLKQRTHNMEEMQPKDVKAFGPWLQLSEVITILEMAEKGELEEFLQKMKENGLIV